MATIDIMANGQKYPLKGMRDAGGWVQAINSAKMMSGTVRYGAQPQQDYAPPSPPQAMSAGNKFCSNCGAPVAAGNVFCGKCGTRVQ